MKKKFKLVGEPNEHGLRRIQAVREIRDADGYLIVHKGTLGGWVADESNLSHKGACWIADDASVMDAESQIRGDAVVHDRAKIFNSYLNGNVHVRDDAVVKNSYLLDRAIIQNKAVIEDSEVHDDVHVNGDSKIIWCQRLGGNGRFINVHINFVDATYNKLTVPKGTKLVDVKITDPRQVVIVPNVGSRTSAATFVLYRKGRICVMTGCFYGTLTQFKKAVKNTHGYDSFYGKQYLNVIDYAVKQFSLVETEIEIPR